MNQWVQAIDPVSGQVYYANCSTGETSWFPPPPPPHDVAAQQQNHHNNVVIGQAAAHNTIPPTAQLQQQHSQPLTTQQNTNDTFLSSSNSVTYQLDPSTATTPGLLVPSIRAIIDKEQAQKMSIGRKIELEGVSAGTIADLCNVSREWRSRNVRIDGGDFAEEQNASTPQHGQNENESSNIENEEAANYYYMPLQPFSLPLQSRPPHIEPGRVDIRMHALYSKLRSFAEENSV